MRALTWIRTGSLSLAFASLVGCMDPVGSLGSPIEPGAAVPADPTGELSTALPQGRHGEPIEIRRRVRVALEASDYLAGEVAVRFSRATVAFDERHAGDPCRRETKGGCVLEQCPGGNGGAPPSIDGGVVTVRADGSVVELARSDAGFYPQRLEGGLIWPAGRQIRIHSGGGDAPAFAGEVAMPQQVLVSDSSMGVDAGRVTLDRGEGLRLRWAGESAGQVRVRLHAVSAQRSVSLACEFRVSDGSGTLPAELVGQLPASANARFEVATVATSRLDAGAWPVELSASVNAVGLTGEAQSFDIALR